MKLRNKKTGQLGNFIINKDHFECVDLDYVPEYRNLAELNEEWEDYEDGHRVYYLDYTGKVYDILSEVIHPGISLKMKKIGNYFETEEETEKAREKLKAWKRLEDKGFRFSGWTIDDGLRISICTNTDEDDIYDEDKRRIKPDLDLLFGGEDE